MKILSVRKLATVPGYSQCKTLFCHTNLVLLCQMQVYIDSEKQPSLVIENGERECYVMNAGFDSKGIPTITIDENGIYECYRISEKLSGWVQTLLGFVVMGEMILPSKVMFKKKEGTWYAEIL